MLSTRKPMLVVVYFDQYLGAMHPKRWSKYVFLTLLTAKSYLFTSENVKNPVFNPFSALKHPNAGQNIQRLGSVWDAECSSTTYSQRDTQYLME